MRAPTVIACGSLIGVVAGCFLNSSSKPVSVPSQTAKSFPNKESLTPEAMPYSTARLILAGTPVSVQMERATKGADVVFKLIARKEVIEEEHYILAPTVFAFSGLSDETFEPAIPLVRYPFNVGDTWEWTGEARLGTNKKTATAVMSSSAETLNLAGGVYDCVAVVADLVVESGEGAKSKRALRFWIQPKKGIVKREFGFSSTREPRAAGSP